MRWSVNIWLNHIILGFKFCMAMETIVIATKPNYGSVGFGWELDTKMVPLMLLGDRGRPNIGFGFHDGLSFHFGFLKFSLGSAQGKN